MAKLSEVREAGLHALEILQKAGVKIGYGTDLLGPMHRHQSREFVIRAEAMAPFDIIRSATVVNAELLNRPGELGVIAPGARADLIAVEGDPLADIALLDGQGEHLTHIMKDGVFLQAAITRDGGYAFSSSRKTVSPITRVETRPVLGCMMSLVRTPEARARRTAPSTRSASSAMSKE